MKRLAIGLSVLAVAAVAVGTALAASGSDQLTRYRISYTSNTAARMVGTSINFYVPAGWHALKPHDKRHQSFREGQRACLYTVTFTTRQAPDSAETPLEHVTAKEPAAGAPYVLDFGTRGSATAWRVVRVKTSTQQVRLRAMRADRRSIGSGAHVWQETVVSASSRKGGECHAGTYREVLGPQIGNALATATGRAYDFATRG